MKNVKVTLTYAPTTIDVVPADVADVLEPDASDADILAAISEHISEAATNREWPSYSIRDIDRNAILTTVKAALKAKAAEEEED